MEGKGEGNPDRRCGGSWRGSLPLNGREGRSTGVEGNVGRLCGIVREGERSDGEGVEDA